jgi:hypothetical protein
MCGRITLPHRSFSHAARKELGIAAFRRSPPQRFPFDHQTWPAQGTRALRAALACAPGGTSRPTHPGAEDVPVRLHTALATVRAWRYADAAVRRSKNHMSYPPTARCRAAEARTAGANERAAKLSSIVKDIQAAGITSLNGIAETRSTSAGCLRHGIVDVGMPHKCNACSHG